MFVTLPTGSTPLKVFPPNESQLYHNSVKMAEGKSSTNVKDAANIGPETISPQKFTIIKDKGNIDAVKWHWTKGARMKTKEILALE